MAGPHAHRIALFEQRGKESEAGNVIEMGVREIDVDVERCLAGEFYAQRANTRPGVEDQPPTAGGDFQTRCIAAIADVFCAGA